MVLLPARGYPASTSTSHVHGGSSSSSASASYTLQRIDTLAIKAQLGAALGENQIHYWHALRSFCTAALDRAEFEQLARGYLGKDLIHLHNALIMGILHNASPGVPGPSNDDDPTGNGSSKRRKPGDPDPDAAIEVPLEKRQRLIIASLPKRERQRIKTLGKLSRGAQAASAAAAAGGTTSTAATASSALSALGPTLSAASAAGSGDGGAGANAADNAALLLAGGVGWAGANADMLERKRKEQEKRKAAEEKRRIRENLTNIGARDWRGETTQQANALESVREKLSASTQSAIMRALSASLCIDSKELPDIESLRDRMTLQAVEAGLPGGVHPQAAAMVLLALQGHIQNVVASVIGKLRTRGTGAAVSEDAEISAAVAAAALAAQAELQRGEAENSTPARGQIFSPIENRAPGPNASLQQSAGSPYGGENGLAAAAAAAAADASLSSLPLAKSLSAATDLARAHDNTVKLSDMAMLFDLAPQTAVEPLGLGTQNRMLAPEYEGNLDASPAFLPASSFSDPASAGTRKGKNGERQHRGGPGSSSSEDDEDEVAAVI